MLMFVDIETVTQRPAFQEDVEFQLSHFVSMEEVGLAEELLRSIGTHAIALSSPYSGSGWACVLKGDFTRVQGALRQAAESGTGLSTTITETHQQVEIFALIRHHSSGYESQIYLAMPDQQTLAVSPDLNTVRVMIEQRQAGLSLPQPMAVMLQDWGFPDYLQVFEAENFSSDDQSTPIDALRLYGVHLTLADDATTTLRFLQQFEDATEATAAKAWLQEQSEPHLQRVGLGRGVQIDQWRVKGPTVYAEVTVPDEDVLDLITPE